jgi:hypothetical protein
VPKSYKPSAGDLNEKSGGDQEMANRKYKASGRLLPGVDYSREMNTYMNARDSKGRSYTPRTSPGFSPKRNEKDLAAQSAVDEAITGHKPKRQGGGPGQRPGVNMINNLKKYARGGGIESKGKTKGRFV